ncbi:MAG: hypothetical protein H0V42_00820 [Nocardioidaceae bacterium]|nr:hypothetical protein [Nocardioidaceae bacterium]
MSFTQLLPDEGTERGLLRVVNTSDADLHVTGIGLDWPGFGDAFRQDKDSMLLPEQTLDLRITLPAPDCENDSGPVVGLVESGDAAARQELVDSGQVFVRRLWAQQCSARFVSDRVSIEYGERWRRLGSGADSSIVGTLALTRREGTEPIRLLSVQGSVLYGLSLPGPRELAAGVPKGSLPIEILPGNRCDEHARGQATAPFTFRLELKIGDAPANKVLIEPPLSGQTAATALLDRVCA